MTFGRVDAITRNAPRAQSDFRQVGIRSAKRDNGAMALALSEDASGPSAAQRWRSAAAYATWLAIATHVAVTLVRGAPTTGQWVGAVCFVVCIGFGYYQLCRPEIGYSLEWFRTSVFIQTAAALAALALVGIDTLAILLIVIAAQVAEREPGRAIIVWMLSANVVLIAIHFHQSSVIGAVIRTALQVGFQFFAVSISLALAGERQAKEKLVSLNAELIATRRLLGESTRAQERLRISRELHDVAGHRLTALKLNLESSLRKHAAEGALHGRLTLCRDLTAELLDDIRSVVHQLRETEDLDLRRALEPLAKQLPDTTVELQISPQLSVSRIEVAETIVRCAQEAITNALKHGGARHVWVSVAQEEDRLTLTVRDNGSGGPSDQPGHGLRGMSERAESLGGTLRIVAPPRTGWELRLELPAGAQ